LLFLAAALAALALARSELDSYQRARLDPAAGRFAQADRSGEVFLLALNRVKSARQIDPSCPDQALKELDRLQSSDARCQIFPAGASNFVRLAAGKKVDLNGAGIQELTLVSGIGQKRAEQLLRLKEEAGGFRTWDQLQKLNWLNGRMRRELERYFALGDGA